MSFKIYLVEDDKNLNLVLTTYLKKEGWEVSSVFTGEDALNLVNTPPDLWILDIMLPDIDGYQIIKKIKSISPNIPVIFISARDADIDRVLGLELGSDDYLSKPFLPRELIIRSKKLLERVYGSNSQVKDIAPYVIDKKSRRVKINNKSIDLTSKEFDLLSFLVENQDQALSREQILEYVWDDDYFGTDRVVDDLIRRLRKKMPKLNIETIYGYGYRMIKS
ncbi:response regulator transcription factor [Schnuerera sp. xch1]|uniref:response regulator transcription factor n=1 Tax=Schnuerera sp. xch1 TaxID=2874283 RepID=UPI001CBDF05D|nr:response regulator transcription factor [Schnuerera sp. xch1]MBZ2174696.1 response regulator transcription factor [Schnuerera sp. xch1]